MQGNNLIDEGFLKQGCLIILTAPPKTGKTAIATALALAVAKGKPFAGRQVQKGPVLWLALEESPVERAVIMRYARARPRTPFLHMLRKHSSRHHGRRSQTLEP